MDKNKVTQAVGQNEQARKASLGKLIGKLKLRSAMMVMSLVSLLSISAFAADEGGGELSSGFSAVWSSFDDLGTLMTKVWSMMTANPLLCIFLAVLLLGIGCRVVRMLMRTARGR